MDNQNSSTKAEVPQPCRECGELKWHAAGCSKSLVDPADVLPVLDSESAWRVEWLFREKLGADAGLSIRQWIEEYNRQSEQSGARIARDLTQLYGGTKSLLEKALRVIETLAIEPARVPPEGPDREAAIKYLESIPAPATETRILLAQFLATEPTVKQIHLATSLIAQDREDREGSAAEPNVVGLAEKIWELFRDYRDDGAGVPTQEEIEQLIYKAVRGSSATGASSILLPDHQ